MRPDQRGAGRPSSSLSVPSAPLRTPPRLPLRHPASLSPWTPAHLTWLPQGLPSELGVKPHRCVQPPGPASRCWGDWLDTPLQPAGSIRASLPRGRGGGRRPGPHGKRGALCGRPLRGALSVRGDNGSNRSQPLNQLADEGRGPGSGLQVSSQPIGQWRPIPRRRACSRLPRGRLRSHFSLR